MTRCANCNREIENEVNTCPYCGAAVAVSTGSQETREEAFRRVLYSNTVDEALRPPVEEEDEASSALGEDKEIEETPPEKMCGDIRGWGFGLIIIGIAHYFIPFLESTFAFILVPIGILSLIFTHRVMFIVIDSLLILIGLLNIFSGGFRGWMIYGGLQIYWGIKEISKFGNYSNVH